MANAIGCLFANVKTRFIDAVEYESLDGIRILEVNIINYETYCQAKKAGGALASIDSDGVPVVIFTNTFRETLGDEDCEAILWHEIGHHLAGHTAEFAKHSAGTFVKVNEAEADAVAIDHVGPMVYKRAFFKMLHAYAAVVGVPVWTIITMQWLSEPKRMWAML